jgi:hypothetical protein
MKATQITAVAALIVVGAMGLHVAPAQQPGTRRIDLQRHDLSAPDARWCRHASSSTREWFSASTGIRAKRSSMSSRARWSAAGLGEDCRRPRL